MFYIWEETGQLHNFRENIILDNMKDLMDFKMTIPERIDKEFPRLKFSSTGNFDIPDYIKYGVLFIVSERLLLILEKYSVALQSFPIDFIHNEVPLKLNVVHLIEDTDFINEKMSGALLEENGYIEEIESLVIDEAKLVDKNLATSGRYLACLVIASKPLKEEIESLGFTGVRFTHPGNYKPW